MMAETKSAERYSRKKKSEIEIVAEAEAKIGRSLPNVGEIEELVLGALLIDERAIDRVVDLLKSSHFYKREHQLIFDAIIELYAKRDPIDMHTVTEQLRLDNKLEEVGGAYYIATLSVKVASSAHIDYHAKIIAQKSMAREIITICSETLSKAYDESTDVDDLLQGLEGRTFLLSQNTVTNKVTQIDPVIEEAYQRLQKASQQAGGTSGVPSGFHAVDKVTMGWQKSDLIIVAARPAMGKTAFVLSMAKNIAVDYHIPVAIFSLEMSNVQLVNRLIVNVCSIPGDKIRSGQLEPYEWKQFDAKIGNLQGAPIYLDDTSNLSITEFQTKARRLKEEHDIQIIIIDYLQLMNASGMRFQSREQEVSMISRSLKGLAKELDIPIIALSQLNRNLESRGKDSESKKPQLSDLRESGAIEQDADMVCFIHRPEYYGITEDPSSHKDLRGVAQLIIAKHRNGATADIDLRFKHDFARFMNEDDDEFEGGTFVSGFNQQLPPPSPADYQLPQGGSDVVPF